MCVCTCSNCIPCLYKDKNLPETVAETYLKSKTGFKWFGIPTCVKRQLLFKIHYLKGTLNEPHQPYNQL